MSIPPPPPGAPLSEVVAWHRSANDAVAARLRVPAPRPEVTLAELVPEIRRANGRRALVLARMKAAVEAMEAQQGESSCRRVGAASSRAHDPA